MIETDRYDATAPDTPHPDCKPPDGWLSEGQNEVMFVNDAAMYEAECTRDARACWRSSTMLWVYEWSQGREYDDFLDIAQGTILLRNAVYPEGNPTQWNILAHEGACNLAEHTVTHEAGHALGIGWPNLLVGGFDHPRNATHSIMSEDDFNSYCEPQAYDVVAIKANYQSR